MEDTPAADAWLVRLLTEPVLFDTMIVRHLCEAGAGDALYAAFEDRFRWGEAVQYELTKQSKNNPPLREFMARHPGIVIELSDEEEREVEDIRLDMYGRGEVQKSDTEHLGESQCLYLARRDGLVFTTNDTDARKWAHAQWDERNNRPRVPNTYRVELADVCQVLFAIARRGGCRPGRAWDHYVRASNGGTFAIAAYPIPGSRDRFITEANNLWALFEADARRPDRRRSPRLGNPRRLLTHR